MDLINFIGAQVSKDGKWLLVTFGRKGTDEKVRWLVPFNTNRAPIAFYDEGGKTCVFFPMSKKSEEPKQEASNKIAEEELPF